MSGYRRRHTDDGFIYVVETSSNSFRMYPTLGAARNIKTRFTNERKRYQKGDIFIPRIYKIDMNNREGMEEVE